MQTLQSLNAKSMSWKGRFLPAAPKVVEKRPREDDDNDEEESTAQKEKRTKRSFILEILAENDKTLREFFDTKNDTQALALQYLYPYRYDSLVSFLAGRPDFETLTDFVFEENINMPRIAERFAESASTIRNSARRYNFSRVEQVYADVVAKSLYALTPLATPQKEREFHDALVNLFLARFNATPQIKEILDINDEVDVFGDVLLEERIDMLFSILSEAMNGQQAEEAPELNWIVQQRILSFLEGDDFNNYCKTTKGLSEACSTGRWKDAISDFRFERQFGKDAPEVMELRYRFFVFDVKLVQFRNAAIKVAKFFNQFLGIKDDDERKKAIETKVQMVYPVNALSPSFVVVPLVLYHLRKAHPSFAENYFLSVFTKSSRLLQSVVIDKQGKIFTGESLLEYLVRANKKGLLIDVQEATQMRAVFEADPNNDAWSETMEEFLAFDVSDSYHIQSFSNVVVPRWLETTAGKTSRIREAVIKHAVENVFVRTKIDELNFDVNKTSPELWNRCISYALEQEATSSRSRYLGAYLRDRLFLSLQLMKYGKLDENLAAPAMNLLSSAFFEDLLSNEQLGIFGIPVTLFEANGSPDIWLPIARRLFEMIDDSYGNVARNVEAPVCAAWLALQMLKDKSEENRKNLEELRTIGESSMMKVEYTGDEYEFLVEKIANLIEKNDDGSVWAHALRALYDKISVLIRKSQKNTTEKYLYSRRLSNMFSGFYNITRRLNEFGLLSKDNSQLMARFLLKNIRFLDKVEGASDWANRFLGFKK